MSADNTQTKKVKRIKQTLDKLLAYRRYYQRVIAESNRAATEAEGKGVSGGDIDDCHKILLRQNDCLSTDIDIWRERLKQAENELEM